MKKQKKNLEPHEKLRQLMAERRVSVASVGREIAAQLAGKQVILPTTARIGVFAILSGTRGHDSVYWSRACKALKINLSDLSDDAAWITRQEEKAKHHDE